MECSDPVLSNREYLSIMLKRIAVAMSNGHDRWVAAFDEMTYVVIPKTSADPPTY